MNYYFEVDKPKEFNAGTKAPDDICKIADMKGWRKFSMPYFPKHKGKLYQKAWLTTVAARKWLELFFKLKNEDNVIFQYPMYGYALTKFFIPFIKKYKNVNFITIIHDIESLRLGIGKMFKFNASEQKDITLLGLFDKVISHNNKMSKYLIENGISSEKIVNLEIFDYLDSVERYDENKVKDNSIVIAGILAPEKSGYLYKLLDEDLDLTINLFGPHFVSDRLIANYHGAFPPNDLIKELQGDFGIIWDGPEIDTCAGNTGRYLRFNNPHKTSLFCAANIPIIVWEEAAIADFVRNNKIGIVVPSLKEIDSIIKSLSNEEYMEMYNNMREISKKVRSGYYFSRALDEAVK